MHRNYNPEQTLLFPEDVRDYLGENHEAALIYEAVKAVTSTDPSFAQRFVVGNKIEGRPAFDPIMMVSLLCYAYAIGVRSSRKIGRLPIRDMGAYWLSAGERPNFRTVCLFRTQNEAALEELFSRVLLLAEEMGLLKLGVLTLDGTKIRANAQSGMCTEENLNDRIKEHRKKIHAIVKEVELNDKRDDTLYGKNRDGNELNSELTDKDRRREKLRSVAAALCKQGDRKGARQIDASRETVARLMNAKKAARKQTSKKASSSDPDARLMKFDGGRIVPAYNAQAIVEEGSKIIVGATVIQDANDSRAAKKVLKDAAKFKNGKLFEGRTIIADNGYFTPANFSAFENHSLDFLVRPDGEGNRQFVKDQSDKAPVKFTRSAFRFHDRGNPKASFYTCRRGRRLRYVGKEWLDSHKKRNRSASRRKGLKYRSPSCTNCPFTGQCLQKDGRRRTVLRDPAADHHKDRLRELFKKKSVRKKYTIRMYTAEPVFGTIKELRGMRHFALRGLTKVNTEWRWACLTHNLLTVAKRIKTYGQRPPSP